MEIKYFSKGKNEDKNEDFFGYSQDSFVIADGATDKSGRIYNGKTGGEIVSRLVVDEALSSNLNGVDLINFINSKVYKVYESLGIAKDMVDPKYRFSCFCIVARIIKDKLLVTYIGDTGFRINGGKIYKETKLVDINTAEERARYIRETGDVGGSREHIMPLLLKQFEYQNKQDSSLGYGVIDGTKTPEKFIKTLECDLDKVNTIELFTDGYFEAPSGVSIEAWEKKFNRVEKEDPDKWKKYKSTKSKDDRTIVIIKF